MRWSFVETIEEKNLKLANEILKFEPFNDIFIRISKRDDGIDFSDPAEKILLVKAIIKEYMNEGEIKKQFIYMDARFGRIGDNLRQGLTNIMANIQNYDLITKARQELREFMKKEQPFLDFGILQAAYKKIKEDNKIIQILDEEEVEKIAEVYARLADPGINKVESNIRLLEHKESWVELDSWLMEDEKFTHVINSENCTLSFKAPEPSKGINLVTAGKIFDFICTMLLKTGKQNFEFNVTDFFKEYHYGLVSHERSVQQESYNDFVRAMHFMSTVHVSFTGLAKNKKAYKAHGNLFAYSFVENSNKRRLKLSILWADELTRLVEDKNAMYMIADSNAYKIDSKRHKGKELYIKQALERRYAFNKSNRNGNKESISMSKLIEAYGTTENQLKKRGKNYFADKVASILDDLKEVGTLEHWDYKNVPAGRGNRLDYASSIVEFEMNHDIAKAYDGMKAKKKKHYNEKRNKIENELAKKIAAKILKDSKEVNSD